MERRTFCKSAVLGAGGFAMGSFACSSFQNVPSIFPKSKPPKKLDVCLLKSDLSWTEKNLLTCLQGLVNRERPEIYYIIAPQDKFWLDYYKSSFGVDYVQVEGPDQLYKKYMDRIAGYVLYDEKIPHSLNVATTIGGVKNALPISKNVQRFAEFYGLKQIDEVPPGLSDMFGLYEWALEKYLPDCYDKIIAQLCVHSPHWPTSTYTNRDYVIAHKIFSLDISSSERDKQDYNLLKKIYQRYNPGAMVIGWHCVRDKEHEAIGLAAQFGHYGMCNLNTPNMSVHASIPLDRKKKFKQRKRTEKDLKLENKVYIALMATDGDAAWFMRDLVGTDWADPLHGTFKYNWGFLPLAYDLMPGTVQYYLENMHKNDYFVAGPAGAAYTYPFLHPDPKQFLKLSRYYMNKCGLKTVHMTNWNDRDWWQEVDVPDFTQLLREQLPECVGFVRGMGESAFEKSYLQDKQPYIFCGEGIHRNSDIYQTYKDFLEACPQRPLFIYSLVNHSVPLYQTKEAFDKLENENIEFVHLDELLLLVKMACKQGIIKNDLYPDKTKLKLLLEKEARKNWISFYSGLLEWKNEFNGSEKDYIAEIKQLPIGLEHVHAGEFLAFSTIWHAMTLVKLTLESKGIYVNHKPRANKRFIKEFADILNVDIILTCQLIWNNWHKQTMDYEQAKSMALDFTGLADKINTLIFS